MKYGGGWKYGSLGQIEVVDMGYTEGVLTFSRSHYMKYKLEKEKMELFN